MPLKQIFQRPIERCAVFHLGPGGAPLLREALKAGDAEPAKRVRPILLEFADRAARERFEKR